MDQPYWEIKDKSDLWGIKSELSSVGYPAKKGTRKSQIREWLEGRERQRPNYYACSTQELRKFVTDRRAMPRPSVAKRDGLIRALYQNDDSPRFEKFLDLPPGKHSCLLMPEHY